MFKDRFDAGHQLAQHLKRYLNNPNALVIAVPRGGLAVGYVIAHELHLPLDVILTKKIGYPGNPEYAIGCVSLDYMVVTKTFSEIPEWQGYIAQEVEKIRKVLHERNALYHKSRPPLELFDKIIIVIDDGVATGNTLLMTLALIVQAKPQKIVVALPVAAPSALELITREVNETICLQSPQDFQSVGQFYQDFNQVSDQEALELLHKANL